MPQLVDRLRRTLSTSIDAADTSITLDAATDVPDPSEGHFWALLWNSSAGVPVLDDNAELIRVEARSGATLSTVVRGQGGTTAKAHPEGTLFEIVAGAAEFRSSIGYNPLDFGADPTGSVDCSAAFQACIDRGLSTGYPVDIWPGDYLFTTGLTDPGGNTDRGIHLIGHGRNVTTLIDQVSGGPFFRSTTNFRRFTMERMRVKISGNKTAQNILEFDGNRTAHHVFRDIEFQGNGKIAKAFVYLNDTWEVLFDGCTWDVYNGICVQVINDDNNGGNVRFNGGDMVSCRCGIDWKGTSTNNSLSLLGTKFAFVRDGDRNRINNLSTYSAGSTMISIGSGLSYTANVDAVFIGNDDRSEVQFIQSYDSGSGMATLYNGLENDYTSDSSVEVIIGSPSLVVHSFSPGITAIGSHHEDAPIIISNCPNFALIGIFASHLEQSYFGVGASFGCYVQGKIAVGSFISPSFTTDRSDQKFVNLVNSEGSGNVAGPLLFTLPTESGGGATTVLDDPVSQGGSTNQRYWVFSDGRLTLTDVNLYRDSANNWKTDDNLEIEGDLTLNGDLKADDGTINLAGALETTGDITTTTGDITTTTGNVDASSGALSGAVVNLGLVAINESGADPEDFFASPKGSLYLRTGGSGGDEILYVKAFGSGSSGWRAVSVIKETSVTAEVASVEFIALEASATIT